MRPTNFQLAFFTIVCLGIASQIFIWPHTSSLPKFHPQKGTKNILIQDVCGVPYSAKPCRQAFFQFKSEEQCLQEAKKLEGGSIKFECADEIP